MVLIISVLTFCFIAGCLIPLPWRVKGSERSINAALVLAGLGSLVALGGGIYFAIRPMLSGVTIGQFPALIDNFPRFTVSFYADRLAGLFLILTGGLSLAAVLHMVDWLKGISDRHRIVSVYNLFVLSILLTILANTVYLFLFFLEGITLSYTYLVLFRHNQSLDQKDVLPETMEAAKTAFKTYLIFEHIGVMLLAVALIILSVQTFKGAAVGFDFDRLRIVSGGSISRPAASLVFILAFAGLGIKAGMVPVHVWVPMVHPYSPTSIHAMMSGIVLEVAGIYGMYRVFFEFSGPGEAWWGLLVLLLAGASALVGAFYAMLGRDLKTALASHSVEHIGIILAGIGLALLCRWAVGSSSEGMSAVMRLGEVSDLRLLFLAQNFQKGVQAAASSFRAVEALALIASLYHLVNHSIFKSLLFFATGAIENRTGTTTLDRLGGLVKRYPWTSATFLVGAAAIAGLPPLNGFASEWLTLQALFSSMSLFLPGIQMRIILLIGMVIAILCLALAFGITALALVKMSGEALLGMPRDPQVAQRSKPGEVSWHIRSVLVALAGLCLLLGMFPSLVANGLAKVSGDLCGPRPCETPIRYRVFNLIIDLPIYRMEKVADTLNTTTTVAVKSTSYITRLSGRFLWVLLALILTPFAMNLGLSRLKQARRLRLRRGAVWTGGGGYQPETMQYTGGAFSSFLWMSFEERKMRLFTFIRHAKPGGSVPDAGTGAVGQYLPVRQPVTGRHAVLEVFRLAYDRAVHFLLRIAQIAGDRVQPGDIRYYLLYIIVMFFLVLAILLMFSGAGR